MLTQLAAERQTILDTYNGSDEQLDQLIAVEAAIVEAPHSADSDRAIKSTILYETGKPDLADLFKERLFKSLQ